MIQSTFLMTTYNSLIQKNINTIQMGKQIIRIQNQGKNIQLNAKDVPKINSRKPRILPELPGF
jgi:hypothetical protein